MNSSTDLERKSIIQPQARVTVSPTDLPSSSCVLVRRSYVEAALVQLTLRRSREERYY